MKRYTKFAAICLMAVGSLHLLSELFMPRPETEAFFQLKNIAEAYLVPMDRLRSYSFWSLSKGISINMGILLIGWGLQLFMFPSQALSKRSVFPHILFAVLVLGLALAYFPLISIISMTLVSFFLLLAIFSATPQPIDA
ncbi:MAG: hypothetical protein AAF206_24605 [Bacteroidota bacterium]